MIAVALNVAAVLEELTTCLADFRDAPAPADLDDIPIGDFLAAGTAADDPPTDDWALARKQAGADLVGDFVRKKLKRSRLPAMPGTAPWRRCSSAHWPLWSEFATFYSSIPAWNTKPNFSAIAPTLMDLQLHRAELPSHRAHRNRNTYLDSCPMPANLPQRYQAESTRSQSVRSCCRFRFRC